MIIRDEVRETKSAGDKRIKDINDYEKLVQRVLLNFKLMAIALVAYTIWRNDVSLFFSFSFLYCFGIDLIESLFRYYKLTEVGEKNEH